MLVTSCGKAVDFSLLGDSLESKQTSFLGHTNSLICLPPPNSPGSQPALSALGPDCPKVLLFGAFYMEWYLVREARGRGAIAGTCFCLIASMPSVEPRSYLYPTPAFRRADAQLLGRMVETQIGPLVLRRLTGVPSSLVFALLNPPPMCLSCCAVRH